MATKRHSLLWKHVYECTWQVIYIELVIMCEEILDKYNDCEKPLCCIIHPI